MTSTILTPASRVRVRRWFCLSILVLLSLPASAFAQGLATWFGGRGIDIGWYSRDVHRNFVGETSLRETDWSTGAVFVRVGVAGRFGLLISGYTWEPEESERFPGRRYREVTFGAGLTGYPLVRLHDRVGFTLNYLQMMMFDESSDHYHKRTDNLILAAHYERSRRLWDQMFTAWLATAYVVDSFDNYPYGGDAVGGRSRNNIGCVLGVNIALAGHVKPYVQALYADFWESELVRLS